MIEQIRQAALAWMARRQRAAGPRGLILMYHRVTRVTPDPWALCVAPENFAAQWEVLRRDSRVMPLREMVAAQRAHSLPDRAVAITFDDGYADNLHQALPQLEAAGLPATFFIATGYLGQAREFWWDELGRILLETPTLPPKLALTIGTSRVEWNVERLLAAEPEEGSRVDRVPTRDALYQDVWRRLYAQPHAARTRLLDELAAWAGTTTAARDSHRSMTHAELAEFAASPLVEIGGHTVTHPSLPAHPARVQWQEIQENRMALETILGEPVKSFSYPHGDASGRTARLLRKAGFASACTVKAQPVWRGSHPLQLPRYPVEDWSGEEFARRLAGWLE